MKSTNLIRMSLAQKPEQVYYVPPRARVPHPSTKIFSSSHADTRSLNSKAPLRSPRSDLSSVTDVTNIELSSPSRNKLEDSNPIFSLADRLESLEVDSSSPVKSRNSSWSLKENTIFLKASSKKHTSSESKKRASFEVYVPPHKRNQNGAEVLNVCSDEDKSPLMRSSDASIEDDFINFRSRKSDSFLYKYQEELVNNDIILEDLCHVLEVTNFDSNFTEIDVLDLFQLTKSSVGIRWISDTAALLAFETPNQADSAIQRFLNQKSSETVGITCSRLQNASVAGRKKAFAIYEELKQKTNLQPRERPETTDFFARQVIGRHLGRSDIIPKQRSVLKHSSSYNS